MTWSFCYCLVSLNSHKMLNSKLQCRKSVHVYMNTYQAPGKKKNPGLIMKMPHKPQWIETYLFFFKILLKWLIRSKRKIFESAPAILWLNYNFIKRVKKKEVGNITSMALLTSCFRFYSPRIKHNLWKKLMCSVWRT